MRKKPGLLDQIDSQSVEAMVASMRDSGHSGAAEGLRPRLRPDRATMRKMVDEDLAELIARGKPPHLAKLAESEMRTREAWRGPARWSLLIAAAALLVSVAAFVRAG